MSIPAKPTRYGAYTFRSQLEARWAYFFQAMGIRYLYEPRLYQLRSDLWYKPDFFLRDHRCFVEIKGECPASREKMRLLAQKHRINVYTFYGDVGVPSPDRQRGVIVDYGDDYYFQQKTPAGVVHVRCPFVRCPPSPGAHLLNVYGKWGRDYGWCECQQCGMVAIASAHSAIRWQCACVEPFYAPHLMDSPRLQAAYQAANRQRFSPSSMVSQQAS